jgi:hypothetical protein
MRQQEGRERAEQRDQHNRREIARSVNFMLRLDGDEVLGADDIRIVSKDWDRPLGKFKVAGLTFIAGSYWHGNPGNGFLLAVKVLPVARITWPPPRPRSASNNGWAPPGYRAITGPADLAGFATNAGYGAGKA